MYKAYREGQFFGGLFHREHRGRCREPMLVSLFSQEAAPGWAERRFNLVALCGLLLKHASSLKEHNTLADPVS